MAPTSPPTAGPQNQFAAGNGDNDAWRHVHNVVGRSGSSFLWGMRVLPHDRRQAMYAIYAFCREVDDVADEPGEVDDKRRQLSAWREEIDALYQGKPIRATTRALLQPVTRFALPQAEFLAVIDGMETDAVPTVRMQSMADLLIYCRRVAGAVGMLSIHAFGTTKDPAPRVAIALGNALQLTNILRDIREDAASDRLYLPAELLARHGISAGPLDDILAHPGFAAACRELAGHARDYFAETDRLMAAFGWRRMRPAVLMMEIYRKLLDRLEHNGWHDLDAHVSLSRPLKLWIALRYGLL